MTDAITLSVERQSGLMRELTMIANNVANASTTGYKKEAAVFAEFMKKVPGQDAMSMGSLRGHYTDLSAGAFQATDAPLDVAIEGDGFFGVERGGEQLLTRDGHFQLDAEGALVTADGFAVLDEGGGPIELPPGTGEVAIGRDGTITADGVPFAQLGVFAATPETLTRAGGNLWSAGGRLEADEDPRVRQGFLENANVSPVEEMARLIEAQRMYEAGSNLQSDEHERLRSLIEALGQQ
ncbi:flagellar basal-body rod protein FlgF [Parvularcula maris]|uniref:Flagellar basal-body rod protein FlgF n=1 Tax=Parvularcula maris TaxID=2965077 RepID=A0A9X2L871_9PROT|nr:flagellar basal-body rod protein FlgF [Parvularcula maris]MCQ8184898.1 flagellar basal-body rod protein FlgF [Parvularcula maris]